MAHTVHAMQMMLHIYDKFADEFDIKLKTVAMRIGNIRGDRERCATLQLADYIIMSVS